jgi:hypothetical protein
MAMTIFLVLNGMGVAFLLYVLANFWKEGHRPKSNARKYAMESGRRDRVDVIVMAHPISHAAHGGISVIPFQARDREFSDRLIHGTDSRGIPEVPASRISTWLMKSRPRPKDYDGLKEGRRC